MNASKPLHCHCDMAVNHPTPALVLLLYGLLGSLLVVIVRSQSREAVRQRQQQRNGLGRQAPARRPLPGAAARLQVVGGVLTLMVQLLAILRQSQVHRSEHPRDTTDVLWFVASVVIMQVSA
jgi:hypothetical protein